MGLKYVILTAKKNLTAEVLSAFVIVYTEDASRTCCGSFKGKWWKKPKTQTYLPVNCIRHMGQLSRAEAASLWFSTFSSWLWAPGALPGWGSPAGSSPWSVWIWGFSSPCCLLPALLSCAVPVCCWGPRAAGLCANTEGWAELLCLGTLQGLGLTSSPETPSVSAPGAGLPWSVLLPLQVFSVDDKLFSLSAWPCPLCNSLLWLCAGCWELRSVGFRHFSWWKDGNDTHWKTLVPTVKTSWCSGLFSCCFYNTHKKNVLSKWSSINT